MFVFDTEQKVFTIGNVRVGGQPGENPPLIIPSLFQKGDPCVESRRERTFNRQMAGDQIKRLEELSQLTGMPAIVAMVANSGDEMKNYIDFYVGTTDLPFAIDMWNLEPRIEATKYVASQGLQDRLLYNSVTVWSPDVPAEVEQIKALGVKHVVTVVMDMADQLPSGRLSSLDTMMQSLEKGDFQTIIVDTSVMNLPSTGICALSNRLVKEKYGLPAGAASANGTYMWQKAVWKNNLDTWGEKAFIGLDAGTHAATVALWGDFIFSGPMWGNDHVFPAVAAAHAMVSTMRYAETGQLTGNESTPVYKLFPDFVKTLKGEA
ncbi:MAG: tetrahydromethanopterin S-methyltransferase subunit H [Thermoleophilia bacterium]|nr:tetrahydromethanopterin S-methyltransferase subunit H [Thermoleophilia bacterium]